MLKCNFYRSWQYYKVGQCIIACANSVKIVFACHQFMYVFTNVLYPFRSSPFLTFQEEAHFLPHWSKVYVECLYFSSYERSYKERVIKNLAAYKCFRRTEYVVRLYYIITTKVFFCIYYVSTIKGHFCKSFAIFTESILASIKTKLTGSHSIRHKLDQYLLLSPSKKGAKNVNNIFALYCFQLPS